MTHNNEVKMTTHLLQHHKNEQNSSKKNRQQCLKYCGRLGHRASVLCGYTSGQQDSGVASVAQRSGRPLKSIKDRLNGKGGRMRGNLMAKRVISVLVRVTADPNISIRELGDEKLPEHHQTSKGKCTQS